MKVLFVFIVLEHDRRKLLHFNVTEHPTGAWTAQQIVEAFADREAARYLIRDRDSKYSAEVRLRIKSLGMQEIPDPRSSTAGVSVFAETRLVAFVAPRSRWPRRDVR